MASHYGNTPGVGPLSDRTEELKDLTQQFLEQQNRRAMEVGEQINNDLIRGIFEVLINLSYILFPLALGLSLYSTYNTAKSLIEYVSSPGRSVFLALLILLALIVASIIKVYKTSKRMTTKLRRSYDLVMEIFRATLYICFIIFFGPFVFTEPEDRLMIVAFWALVLAVILFVVRKGLKWYNFLVLEKDNLAPWETMDLYSPLLLLQFAKFQDFLQKKEKGKKSAPEPVKSAVIVEEDVHQDQIETPHQK